MTKPEQINSADEGQSDSNAGLGMVGSALRIAKLEREVLELKRQVSALRFAPFSAIIQEPLVARGIPFPTQNQPSGNFWNPQL